MKTCTLLIDSRGINETNTDEPELGWPELLKNNKIIHNNNKNGNAVLFMPKNEKMLLLIVLIALCIHLVLEIKIINYSDKMSCKYNTVLLYCIQYYTINNIITNTIWAL